MAPPKDTARMLGAKALAAGLLCWAVNVALVLTVGRYGPSLVLLGALGVFFGAVLWCGENRSERCRWRRRCPRRSSRWRRRLVPRCC
jgi:hypothetical protein